MNKKRFAEFRKLLDKRSVFKLVCGAGNEDCDQIRKLSMIYTLAGANAFDVSANVDAVEACKHGIQKGIELADFFSVTIESYPFITISMGMPGDNHVRKASILQELCVKCGKCFLACPMKAIGFDFQINSKKCIGCGHCHNECGNNAISFSFNVKPIKDILPKCLDAGAEIVELHAAVEEDERIYSEWRQICDLTDGYVSMCLDRLFLSDYALERRIKMAWSVAPNRLIIQADGLPMSGGVDDFNTTIQTVAIADVIQKRICKDGMEIPILLSGGTNSKTAELASLVDVHFNGVSLGTFARTLVDDLIDSSFDINNGALRNAVTRAKGLVQANRIHLR